MTELHYHYRMALVPIATNDLNFWLSRLTTLLLLNNIISEIVIVAVPIDQTPMENYQGLYEHISSMN